MVFLSNCVPPNHISWSKVLSKCYKKVSAYHLLTVHVLQVGNPCTTVVLKILNLSFIKGKSKKPITQYSRTCMNIYDDHNRWILVKFLKGHTCL